MTKEEKDKEDLECALHLIDNVAARMSNSHEGDYEWGWLDGIGFSLRTFIDKRRNGKKK